MARQEKKHTTRRHEQATTGLRPPCCSSSRTSRRSIPVTGRRSGPPLWSLWAPQSPAATSQVEHIAITQCQTSSIFARVRQQRHEHRAAWAPHPANDHPRQPATATDLLLLSVQAAIVLVPVIPERSRQRERSVHPVVRHEATRRPDAGRLQGSATAVPKSRVERSPPEYFHVTPLLPSTPFSLPGSLSQMPCGRGTRGRRRKREGGQTDGEWKG